MSINSAFDSGNIEVCEGESREHFEREPALTTSPSVVAVAQ